MPGRVLDALALAVVEHGARIHPRQDLRLAQLALGLRERLDVALDAPAVDLRVVELGVQRRRAARDLGTGGRDVLARLRADARELLALRRLQ